MPREQPIQTYYPSARARLIIRFEDYGAKNTPPVADKPPQVKKGFKPDTSQRLKVGRRASDGALVLLGPGDDPNFTGGPQGQTTSDDVRTHIVDGIIPVMATRKQNGPRTANQLSMEFAYGDLPLDPRAMRSVAVEYFLGTVTPEDFKRGIRGEVRSDNARGGVQLPNNVVQATYTDSNGRQRSNLRFRGWADNWAISWMEGETPIATIACTDNTRLMLEQLANPKQTIDPKSKLDQGVADYLSNYPLLRGLAVKFLPAGEEPPTLSAALTKTKWQPKVGPNTAGGGAGGLKVWDYLTDVVTSVGYMLRFEDLDIIIQQPRTYYSSAFQTRGDDPFTGRRLPSGRVLQRRTMVYGVNVVDVDVERNFTKSVPQNVEVRSYSLLRKKTLVARYPSRQEGRNKKLLPGQSADEKWIVKIVHGIEDEATLRATAQAVYEVQGRREMRIKVSTSNLGSYGGGPGDPDLLDTIPGDSMDLEIARKPRTNTITETYDGYVNDAEELLVSLNFSREFARAYQLAVNNVALPTTYVLENATDTWEGDSVSLEFGLINYTEVNLAKELPTGEEPQPQPNAKAPAPVVLGDDS